MKTLRVIIQWLLYVNRNQIHLLSDSFNIKKSPSNKSLSLYPVTRPQHLSQLTDRSTGQWAFSVLYVLIYQPVTVNSSAPRPNKMVSGYNCEPERCSRLADCRSGFKGWRKVEELSWGHKGRENVTPPPRYSQWSCLISQCCSLISTERWFKGWEEGAAIDSSLICYRYVLTTAQVSLWVIITSWEIKQDVFVLWGIMTSSYVLVLQTWLLFQFYNYKLQRDKDCNVWCLVRVHYTEIRINSWLTVFVDWKISKLNWILFEYPIYRAFLCTFIIILHVIT